MTEAEKQALLDRLVQAENTKGTGYFPIKIRYENGEVCTIQHPDHIANGVAFRVLETNVGEQCTGRRA